MLLWLRDFWIRNIVGGAHSHDEGDGSDLCRGCRQERAVRVGPQVRAEAARRWMLGELASDIAEDYGVNALDVLAWVSNREDQK